jgi:FkbM family methyltransferase
MNYNRLINYIRPNTLLDIGAHTGDFTNQILGYSPDCRCILVEANPYCEPFLQKINHPYHITALSDTNKSSLLYVEKANHIGTGASLYKENTEYYTTESTEQIEVQLIPLDTLNIFKNDIIDLIKIDTQGSELDILIGGRKTIMRSKYIIIEVSTIEYNINSPLVNVIMDKMREYSFQLEDILDFKFLDNKTIFQMDFLFSNTYIYK